MDTESANRRPVGNAADGKRILAGLWLASFFQGLSTGFWLPALTNMLVGLSLCMLVGLSLCMCIEHKSYCILLTDSKLPEAIEKLSVLEKTSDGFEIAEADLQLRGPGDILGTAQSGISDLRFVDFITDTELIREARALADKVSMEDPDLSAIHKNLHPLIAENQAQQGAH